VRWLSRFGVAPFLHDHVHHRAFIIDGATEKHPLASDPADRLVEMPA
jgi:hypothetical protein